MRVSRNGRTVARGTMRRNGHVTLNRRLSGGNYRIVITIKRANGKSVVARRQLKV